MFNQVMLEPGYPGCDSTVYKINIDDGRMNSLVGLILGANSDELVQAILDFGASMPAEVKSDTKKPITDASLSETGSPRQTVLDRQSSTGLDRRTSADLNSDTQSEGQDRRLPRAFDTARTLSGGLDAAFDGLPSTVLGSAPHTDLDRQSSTNLGGARQTDLDRRTSGDLDSDTQGEEHDRRFSRAFNTAKTLSGGLGTTFDGRPSPALGTGLDARTSTALDTLEVARQYARALDRCQWSPALDTGLEGRTSTVLDTQSEAQHSEEVSDSDDSEGENLDLHDDDLDLDLDPVDFGQRASGSPEPEVSSSVTASRVDDLMTAYGKAVLQHGEKGTEAMEIRIKLLEAQLTLKVSRAV